MRTRVRVFARPGVTAGFALAGFHAVDVRDAEELRHALDGVGADTGVLLVEDSLLGQLPPADVQEMEHRAMPVTVSFPGPEWAELPSAAEQYILQILQRAIGYRVRLR